MTISDLLIAAAASWYVAYTLTTLGGPYQMFYRLREWHGGKWHGRYWTEKLQPKDVANGLLDCPLCLSIWVAAVFVLAPVGWLTYAFAAAGVAMLLHSYSGWRTNY